MRVWSLGVVDGEILLDGDPWCWVESHEPFREREVADFIVDALNAAERAAEGLWYGIFEDDRLVDAIKAEPGYALTLKGNQTASLLSGNPLAGECQ